MDTQDLFQHPRTFGNPAALKTNTNRVDREPDSVRCSRRSLSSGSASVTNQFITISVSSPFIYVRLEEFGSLVSPRGQDTPLATS